VLASDGVESPRLGVLVVSLDLLLQQFVERSEEGDDFLVGQLEGFDFLEGLDLEGDEFVDAGEGHV